MHRTRRSTFLWPLGFAALLLTLAAPAQAAHKGAKGKSHAAPLAPSAVAGEIVPASAPAALLFEGASASGGLVALLSAASRYAQALQPSLVSQDLTRDFGVDPLGGAEASAAAGLAPEGPRAIVFDPRALGYTAPVADETRAKHVLQVWLAQLGSPRPTRSGPLHGPLASGSGDQVRAGMVAPVAGSLRLITASGRNAAALVSQLAHVGRKAQDNQPLGADETLAAALVAVAGPIRFWSRGQAPVLGSLVAVDASAAGLSAHGLLLASAGSAAMLEGTAPPESACGASPLFCARAAPGPALRTLAPLVAREVVARDLLGRDRDAIDALVQRALGSARGPALLRLESLRARSLSVPEQLLSAMPAVLASAAAPEASTLASAPPAGWSALPAPQSGLVLAGAPQLCLQSQAAASPAPGALWLSAPCAPLPAHFLDEGGAREMTAHLDTQALSRALARLDALDALRGSLAAGAFAVKLLWGPLFANSGPIDLAARPNAQTDAGRSPLAGALDLAFSWPLSTTAVAQ